MLVSVEFEKKDEQKMKDLLKSSQPNFHLFLCGSLQAVAKNLMEECCKCNKNITSADVKENDKLWIIFILENQKDNLLGNMLAALRVKVQSFDNIREFFDSTGVQCLNCQRKIDEKASLPEKIEPVVKQEVEEPIATPVVVDEDRPIEANLSTPVAGPPPSLQVNPVLNSRMDSNLNRRPRIVSYSDDDENTSNTTPNQRKRIRIQSSDASDEVEGNNPSDNRRLTRSALRRNRSQSENEPSTSRGTRRSSRYSDMGEKRRMNYDEFFESEESDLD